MSQNTKKYAGMLPAIMALSLFLSGCGSSKTQDYTIGTTPLTLTAKGDWSDYTDTMQNQLSLRSADQSMIVVFDALSKEDASGMNLEDFSKEYLQGTNAAIAPLKKTTLGDLPAYEVTTIQIYEGDPSSEQNQKEDTIYAQNYGIEVEDYYIYATIFSYYSKLEKSKEVMEDMILSITPDSAAAKNAENSSETGSSTEDSNSETAIESPPVTGEEQQDASQSS